MTENYTAIDKDFIEEVDYTIGQMIEVFNEFHDNIQPNEDSVKYFDGYIERNRNQVTDSQINSLSICIGMLLGETIIKTYGGRWVFYDGNKDDPVIIIGNDETIGFPIQKVLRQFNEGQDESIYAYYLNCKTALMIARDELKKTEEQGLSVWKRKVKKIFHRNKK